MEKEKISEKLKQFVLTELLRDSKYPIREDEALFSSGMIDSFALARIGVFIETEFDLYIADDELTLDNMDTISQMTTKVFEDLRAKQSAKKPE